MEKRFQWRKKSKHGDGQDTGARHGDGSVVLFYL